MTLIVSLKEGCLCFLSGICLNCQRMTHCSRCLQSYLMLSPYQHLIQICDPDALIIPTDSCCSFDLYTGTTSSDSPLKFVALLICRPLINVCDRFDMVGDLTHYLYTNNMLRYIEGYVQKVNPGKAPQVVGALLDSEASDEFVNNLILSVRSLIPVEQLCAEVEQRNRSVSAISPTHH